MKTLFADTSFFVAYLNARDEHYAAAVRWMTETTEPIVTTEWVLAELGNFLSKEPHRRLFGELIGALEAEERVEIVPADHTSFQDALNLYLDRTDKSWSLTDCTSFCLMKERRIKDALTTDRHFQQAGFSVLLK